MIRRGKVIASWSTTLGVLVLLACAVAFKDRIAEQWWLYKLESGELEEQKVAVEKLAELGSVRAVRVMLEVLWEANEDETTSYVMRTASGEIATENAA